MANVMLGLGILSLTLMVLEIGCLGSSIDTSYKTFSRESPQPSSRSMAYFIKRNIEVKKQDRNWYDRVRRAVGGEDDAEPIIETLFITSNITSRFSNAEMESVIHNPWNDDKEATFRVKLPQEAFMSNFTMYIDGELYVAEVKSKEEAEEDYKEAQEQNKTAGMVSNEDWTPEEEVRGMDNFKVSVNIAANSSIMFSLSYMELLKRRGQYEQRISVRPDQIVNDLEVIVLIFEAQGIASIDVREPDSNSVVPLHTEIFHMMNDVVAEVRYHPTVDDQKKIKKSDNKGIKGELNVSYDVLHGNDAGLIQVEEEYFVHFFSPSNEDLEPLKKNVVFVIDISGSMSGDKIVQTREAMLKILEQLRTEDEFVILLFDDEQEYWPAGDTRLMKANAKNINAAKIYVRENVRVDGGTNINDALVSAAEFLQYKGQFGANMIVFLTDGDPTVGVTDSEQILKNVLEATRGKISIFSLGFGFDMRYDLLREISYRNNGFAQRIYTGIDAGTQLEEFFEEINTPLLYDLQISYGDFPVSLTQTRFAQYFQGSEIIVAGKFDEAPEEFDVTIEAMSVNPVNMDKHVICDLSLLIPEAAKPIFKPGSFERLYVYMKIKDQLRKVLMTDNKEEKKELEDFALALALEYHLVTPLTSFIIVQQDSAPDSMVNEGAFYDMGIMASSPGRSMYGKAYGIACQTMATISVLLFSFVLRFLLV